MAVQTLGHAGAADPMRFHVLGPLEVTSAGIPRALGGPKPRALLCALLLRRGEVVSIDHLAAAVWGADPPSDPAGSLQAYVSRLRSAVDPSRSGLLRFRSPGYVLHVSEGDLDATEFTDLVARGLEHARRGQYQAAASLLGSALSLWRGDPLAEFDAAHIDPQARLAQLEELRVVAAEERGAALTRLGQGLQAATELEGLMARLPGRERLAVVLMEALYGCGRQLDALRVYRDLRAYLVEELGVEPAVAARQTHLRLLAHDPALTLSGLAARNELPRPRTPMVGRRVELPALAAALGRSSLVTLTGVGGVGKTRLALEVAVRERSRFPDGVWWCDLAPLRPGSRVSDAVASSLRVRQRPGSTMQDSLLEYLAERRALIVLDNCEHLLADVARLVDRLLSSCRDLVVLATSRETLSIEGERVSPVSPLSEADATALFRQCARAGGSAADPGLDAASVAQICRHLEGLPLGIELAAARTRAMSPAEVLSHLHDQGLLVRRSRGGVSRHSSLTATIDWSYQLLAPQEQDLFARLSVFAGGAHLEAVHAVCGGGGATEAATFDVLTALVDKSMVVVTAGRGDTRYRVLEMLRVFGQDHLLDRDALARRHAEYFTGLAEEAARGVQGPDEARCVERTLPDADNLRVAFEEAERLRNPDLALRLSSALPEVLQLRLGYEAAGWAERALDLAHAEHPLYVATVGAAARGAWNVGDFDRARRLAESAKGAVPAPGTPRTAYPGDVLADITLYEGGVGATMRYYSEAVRRARADDDAIRLVWALYYVAICHAVRRHPQRGVAVAEECLVVAERTANPTARSMARYALGLVLKKSEPSRAMTLFDEAAGLAASVHNVWWEGIALMEAAATRAVHGDPEVAAQDLVAVLDHWTRMGDRTQLWLLLRYVVRFMRRVGADEGAIALHHCLLAHGKVSPIAAGRDGRLLGKERQAVLETVTAHGAAMSLPQAVSFAVTSLRGPS